PAEFEADPQRIGEEARQAGDDLARIDADLGRAPISTPEPVEPDPGRDPTDLLGPDQFAAQAPGGLPPGELVQNPRLVIAVGPVERAAGVMPEPGVPEHARPDREAADGDGPVRSGGLADRPEHPEVPN